MLNKVTETTFQCDSCLDVKGNEEYCTIFEDGAEGAVCQSCFGEIMSERVDGDDDSDCDNYDPSDDIYERWKYNQMMMD